MLHGIELRKHIMKIKEEEKLTFEETGRKGQIYCSLPYCE